MATYRIIFSNSGGELDSRTITFDKNDDLQDGGAAAAEIACEMIQEAGSLRPGDCIRVVEA